MARAISDICLSDGTDALKLFENPLDFQGVYHVSGTSDLVSWADFAREIFQLSGEFLKKDMIVNNITVDHPTKAAYPAYSVLNTDSFEQQFKMQLPDWKLSLNAAIMQWTKNNREKICQEKV